MRKTISILMILLLLLLTGCSKEKQENNNNNNSNTDNITSPVTQPEATLIPGVNGQQGTQGDKTTLTLEDYYPFLLNTEYVYEGTGMEYASYTQVTDFLDMEKGKIQTRTNNGGSESVRVIELKDGKLSIINMQNECYYRENLMEIRIPETEEILLMEPLVEGTKWTLKNGNLRYISAIDVRVETPLGEYNTLEVTTEGDNYTTMDYYAPKVGLVKSIYQADEIEVVSSLSQINTDKAFEQTIEIYYPDVDENIYIVPTTVSFLTNDDTKQVLQQTLLQEVTKDSYLPVASINTKINALSLVKDVVQVDFSKEFIIDMNAGAGYETLILQAITNTLGSYYVVQEVLITVEGKPYESGHILMKEGETFVVNMDRVVR